MSQYWVDKLDWSVRVQIACSNQLIAEVIVQDLREAHSLWSKWSQLRLKNQKPIGGANISHVDVPRLWNVKVGQKIT